MQTDVHFCYRKTKYTNEGKQRAVGQCYDIKFVGPAYKIMYLRWTAEREQQASQLQVPTARYFVMILRQRILRVPVGAASFQLSQLEGQRCAWAQAVCADGSDDSKMAAHSGKHAAATASAMAATNKQTKNKKMQRTAQSLVVSDMTANLG